MKRVFILEDDPQRQDAFIDVLTGADVQICADVVSARAVFRGPYDWILLDHDLGGRVFVDSDEDNTGYQFAKWLADTHPQDGASVVIHSWNVVGAMQMERALQDAAWSVLRVPFGTTVLKAIATMPLVEAQ